jgi:magnesium transporter
MRVFAIGTQGLVESDALPETLSTADYHWISCTRAELQAQQPAIQAALQHLTGSSLLDLHVSDLLNPQLPSRHDSTSRYDVLVLRRLAPATVGPDEGRTPGPGKPDRQRRVPPILRRIDTSPVGFALFDQVLLSVHPADCVVRDAYEARLREQVSHSETRATGTRWPTSPADLMLRLSNQIVDGYLDLRRELTRQLDHWQDELLQPRTRFTNWGALLDARMTLHQLDEICEDQRATIQNWIEALKSWPEPEAPAAEREHELLLVRSRDVLEHIERVVHHVRRLEHGAETAIQMHFSAQGKRTNDIMRTLTALTAIFLPLNLIAAIFGMNFEFLPLIHRQSGFWWAMGGMVAIAGVMGLVFWRKHYLARTGR